MLPRERANWFDTEGNLYVSPFSTPLSNSVVTMCVSQTERTPLDEFANGIAFDGIASRVERKIGNGEGYRLTIDRVQDIAKELSLELPFIRTRRKIEEIRAFLSYLERPRSVVREDIRRARDIASEWDLPAKPSRVKMDPMDRANWHETEGCLSTGPHAFLSKSGAEFIVSQFEIEPLQDFVAGCVSDGVSCSVQHRKKDTGVEYYVRIRRQDQIAFELSKEIPYFRTRKAMIQAQNFANYIWTPRDRFSNSLEVAREMLAGGPVV